MAATWPPTLPQSPMIANYREAAKPTTIRQKMDAGPEKVRLAMSKPLPQIEMRFEMTSTQTVLLGDFYRDTLQHGVASFDMLHPRKGVSVLMHLLKPPAYAPDNSNQIWFADITVEVRP